MCGSMVDIQSATAEIRRGKEERKKEEDRRNQRAKIYWHALFHRAAIINLRPQIGGAPTKYYPGRLNRIQGVNYVASRHSSNHDLVSNMTVYK